MNSRKARLAASSVLAASAALLCLSASLPARAGAFYIQEQSTRGSGRAFSGEVADTGPESLWWNPASIAESPTQAYGSISGIFAHSDVDDRGSTLTLPVPPNGLTVPVGGVQRAYNPVQSAPVGAGGYAMPLGDRFAVGLSVTTPFELQTKYRGDSFARFEALRSRLDTVDIQVTGAVKVLSWLDFGAGADAVYTSARLTNAVPNLAPGAPDGFSDLTGDGWSAGWTVGAQFHPAGGDNKWVVGASYRSAVGRDVSGDIVQSGLVGPLAAANVDTHGSAKFTTPWIAIVGVRYPVMSALTLNAQVQRIGWSRFRNIDVVGIQIFPQSYHDITGFAVGGDLTPNPIVTLRAGVQWDPTPTPDIGRTLRVPDSDRVLISAGGELHFSPRFTVEGALEWIDFLGSRVNSQAVFFPGTPALTVANYTADVQANALVLSAGARWRF